MTKVKTDALSAIVGIVCLLEFLAMVSFAYGAAAPTGALLKAQQDAEARGFIFETNRDEIVAKARKEGRMRALSSLESTTIKAMADAFRSEYPFLNVHVEELTGTDANQRFILEMKSGRATSWD
ncbi:MAG: hypothetical protein ACREOR_02760, partial [Candidatus Binatia bacterium]